jgi:hypothetical protein
VPGPRVIQDHRARGRSKLRGAGPRVRAPVGVVVQVPGPEAEARATVLRGEVRDAGVELEAERDLAGECAQVFFLRVATNLPRSAWRQISPRMSP